ncbi:DNA replication/repair protein RecF [Breznakiellaceae bacterium SP9]
MTFSTVQTVGFRNLIDAQTNFPAGGHTIFFVGLNGQGKSNILEALYFCVYASSFRGAQDKELPRNGLRDCSVLSQFAPADSGSMGHTVQVKIESGKKSFLVDGKRGSDRKELLEREPCIVFCHEDMNFISGSPEQRRWFFDQSMSLYDPLYLDDLRNYRRVLKTRNALLKDSLHGAYTTSKTDSLLAALDPQFALYGFNLIQKRQEATEQFTVIFNTLYKNVAGIENISVRYTPSWKHETLELIQGYLLQTRQREKEAGLSLSGPHRDRYSFQQNGSDFSEKASTGQRRLLALLLRVAQAERYTQMTGKKPILLLDDVLLEMDGEKRKKFISCLPPCDQAFYTFLPEEPYSCYKKSDTLVFSVDKGELKPAD